jgi:hypothetical protein
MRHAPAAISDNFVRLVLSKEKLVLGFTSFRLADLYVRFRGDGVVLCYV